MCQSTGSVRERERARERERERGGVDVNVEVGTKVKVLRCYQKHVFGDNEKLLPRWCFVELQRRRRAYVQHVFNFIILGGKKKIQYFFNLK